MTDLALKSLELAAADLGVTEHPPGSNRGPQVNLYLRACGLDPAKGAYPWCAAFVSSKIEDAAEALALLPQFKRSASCHRLIELNPSLVLSEPEDGCVGVHLNPDSTGHALFVVDALALSTIEGNSDANGSRTGGSVVRNVRPRAYFAAFLAIR